MDEIFKKIDENFESQIEDIKTLVAIDSSLSKATEGAPFGIGAKNALIKACELGKNLGFSSEVLFDCIGLTLIQGEDEGLDILNHLDVVPEGNGWSITTGFQPKIVENKLYGRGSSDNKGPAVSVMYAIKALLDCGYSPKKTIRLIWGTDEETDSRDVDIFYKHYKPQKNTLSPDASFPAINCEKGRFEGIIKGIYQKSKVISITCDNISNKVPDTAQAVLDISEEEAISLFNKKIPSISAEMEKEGERFILTVKGISSHGAAPFKGANALTGLLEILAPILEKESPIKGLCESFVHNDFYGEILGIAREEEFSGKLTISLSSLEYSKETGLNAVFDCRIPVGTDKEELMQKIAKKLLPYGLNLGGKYVEPHFVDPESDFVKTLMDCYNGETGKEEKPKAIAGNTYAHGIHGAVAFGFGDPDIRTNTHGADEYADLNQLKLGTRIYARLIKELCF